MVILFLPLFFLFLSVISHLICTPKLLKKAGYEYNINTLLFPFNTFKLYSFTHKSLVFYIISSILSLSASIWIVYLFSLCSGGPPSAAILILYLGFIPFWVTSIFYIVSKIGLCINLANKFGKSKIFGAGLIFFPFIFLPILAFGEAEYQFEEEDYE